MNCKRCGTELRKNAIYCHECGQKVDEPVICKKCGKELNIGDIYCPNCGTLSFIAESRNPSATEQSDNSETYSGQIVGSSELEKTKLNPKSKIFRIIFVSMEILFVGTIIYTALEKKNAAPISGNTIFGVFVAFAMWTVFSFICSYGIARPGSIKSSYTSADGRYYRASYEYERAIKNGDTVSAATAKADQARALTDMMNKKK